MSDTPQTDTAVFEVYEGPEFAPVARSVVDLDFARTLEREQDKLRGVLETCGRHLGTPAMSTRVDPETCVEESFVDYDKIPALVEALVINSTLVL